MASTARRASSAAAAVLRRAQNPRVSGIRGPEPQNKFQSVKAGDAAVISDAHREHHPICSSSSFVPPSLLFAARSSEAWHVSAAEPRVVGWTVDKMAGTQPTHSTGASIRSQLETLGAWNGALPGMTRVFSTDSAAVSDEELRAQVDTINDKFAEAREEIEMALESMDTVYFNEEAETARKAVQTVLDRFESLLLRLDNERRGALQRSMGLKMEQLKGELEQLKHD